MQSTNIRQIKAALRDQAFLGTAQVSCPWGSVVAVSRWKGQLRVLIRGWGRWYPVESVRIERTGPQLLGGPCAPPREACGGRSCDFPLISSGKTWPTR